MCENVKSAGLAVMDSTHEIASNMIRLRKSVRQDLIIVMNIWLKFKIAAHVAIDTGLSYVGQLCPAFPAC